MKIFVSSIEIQESKRIAFGCLQESNFCTKEKASFPNWVWTIWWISFT